MSKHGIDLDDGVATVRPRRRPSAPPQSDDERRRHLLTIRDRDRKKIAYSAVGTNSYMSVEVLRGQGYDSGADWWSLGVIVFECLYGFPPFVSKSRHQTRQKVRRCVDAESWLMRLSRS